MQHSLVLKAAALACLLVLSLLALSAAKKEAPKPTFRPGAEVTLEIKLKAPGGWKISHAPPIRFTFDKKKLANAGFSVSKTQYDYNPGKYVKELTATIPVKLKTTLEDCTLSVPLDVTCSICDETGSQCSFANESITVKISVKTKQGQDDPLPPTTKGTLHHEHKLSPPV